VIRWPSGCCEVRTEQAKPAHAPGLTLARQADQIARARRADALWPGGMMSGPAGGGRANGSGASADGHDGVSHRCPGHVAPTASVAALISFTYHLPL
jgi:hypothetical protein